MTLCAPAQTESHNMDDIEVNDSEGRAANKTTSTLQLWRRLELLLAQHITHDAYSNIHDNKPHVYIRYLNPANPTSRPIL
jgi:hypothetical protein